MCFNHRLYVQSLTRYLCAPLGLTGHNIIEAKMTRVSLGTLLVRALVSYLLIVHYGMLAKCIAGSVMDIHLSGLIAHGRAFLDPIHYHPETSLGRWHPFSQPPVSPSAGLYCDWGSVPDIPTAGHE